MFRTPYHIPLQLLIALIGLMVVACSTPPQAQDTTLQNTAREESFADTGGIAQPQALVAYPTSSAMVGAPMPSARQSSSNIPPHTNRYAI